MELERPFAMSAERFAPKPGAAEARRIIAADPRADGRRREVMLARGRVQIARSVAGVRMKISLAASAYRGVILRLRGFEAQRFSYEIELAHRDPDLSVTLLEASDDGEVQAEWRLWARFLGLPALVEREEGRPEPDAARLGELAVSPRKPRRRGGAMARRRPRFLTRRKTGRGSPGPSLAGAREIFPGSKDGR
ncbi:MAG TPA: DUF6101 family protein [Roseiarcus sp.]|nr:DUF6101 family protein [Roseiarcus sp.]